MGLGSRGKRTLILAIPRRPWMQFPGVAQGIFLNKNFIGQLRENTASKTGVDLALFYR